MYYKCYISIELTFLKEMMLIRQVNEKSALFLILVYTYFFLSGVSFTATDNSQDSRGREGTFFYSTLPLPPAHEHSDIYVQLCTWDDYHIFLIATLVFTRLLLDETYHLIEDSTLTESTLFWRTLLESAIYVHTVKTLICVRNQR